VAWQEDRVIVADCEERGSGKNIDDRPQFRKMLDAAARGEFDVILVCSIDRFTSVSSTCSLS